MSTSSRRLIVTRVRIVVGAMALAGTLFVGGRSIGPVPALGPFLNPATGVWSVARAAVLPRDFSGVIPGLGDEVEVVYDRRGVPHISAASIEDATRALGYVVARDRLFQLELQARAPEGTLTELLGPAVLQLDRRQRSIGLGWGAEKDAAANATRSDSERLVLAYAEGVNAWIDGMGAGDLPFEYHLLGATPRRWEPIYSSLIGKRMGYTLAYETQDLWRLTAEAKVGKAAVDWLFPVNAPIVEPIQPNGADRPRFDFATPPPAAETTAVAASLSELVAGLDATLAQLPSPQGAGEGLARRPETGIGSNNWAVAPSRSATDHALLSGDPHLDLTLPSIWYEVHLLVPGELDVQGVTIPGLPSVIIGFNRDLAWSFTNTGADVLDFYRETFDDDAAPTQYRLDGEWKPLQRRFESYYDPAGELLAIDTVYYTHRGPVLRDGDVRLSMRWTVLEEPLAADVFVDAARASTVDEWLNAMARYNAPAQNGIVADRQGNIAIRSTGLYPIRPDDGDGRTIRDGSTSASDWLGYWPLSSYPFAKNPRQGFLASANQQPVDSRAAGRYLGANWPSPWRALRINRLLRADSQVTVDAMRRYHTDPVNEKTEIFLPAFLRAARNDSSLDEARRLLEEWDRRYTKENHRAILFELAFQELTDRTWDELIVSGSNNRVRTPREAILAALLDFPTSSWWDDRRTSDVVETRDDILVASLRGALRRAKRSYGDPNDGGWRWSEVRHTNVYHLLQLRALSALDLEVQGGDGNLNPSSGGGREGASWRMVVELGPEVRAWATYPGGQSGNPASPWYTDRIEQWARGELDEVLFPTEPSDLAEADMAGRLTLTGSRR